VANYFEEGEFPLQLEEQGLRKGRSIRDGYARGWGLEFGGIREFILADPIYQEAMALAQGRTIQAENCRMNLFLLAKHFLRQILDSPAGGSIVEFGSFRGGSAIFMASVCRSLGLNVKVYALDTFEGMPPTDKGVDAHNAGDFAGVDLDELRAYTNSSGLSEHLEFVQGTFETTAPALLTRIPPVVLAHVDCDVYTSVAYAWDVVKPHMANGGYVAFDDAHMSSCLGATEAVEDLVIRRDGLNCEQIWPHFVFRVWPPDSERPRVEADGISDQVLLDCRLRIQRLEGELAVTAQNSTRLQQRLDQTLRELNQQKARLEETALRLEQADATALELDRAHRLLKQQVAMARTSRWLRLGRMFGVGPEFHLPE
jgi:hypothetical protein